MNHKTYLGHPVAGYVRIRLNFGFRPNIDCLEGIPRGSNPVAPTLDG